MHFVNSPSPGLSGREPHRDHVDRALTDYFRAEMPNPWPPAPAAKPTTAPRLPVEPSRSGWSSRFALAASIALIICGAWLLSGTFKDVGSSGKSVPSLDNGGANRKFGRPEMELIQDPMGPTKLRLVFPAEPQPEPDPVMNQIKGDLP